MLYVVYHSFPVGAKGNEGGRGELGGVDKAVNCPSPEGGKWVTHVIEESLCAKDTALRKHRVCSKLHNCN